MKTTIYTLPVTITESNIHIQDSHLIYKKDMADFLKIAKKRYSDCKVWERKERGLRAEWRTHNMLYRFGIAQDRTRDVDLQVPQEWWEKVGYAVGGFVARVFIK